MVNKDKLKKQSVSIPYMINQDKLSVDIKFWQGEFEQRYDILFHTANSYVSISLSHKQLVLLKEKLKSILL